MGKRRTYVRDARGRFASASGLSRGERRRAGRADRRARRRRSVARITKLARGQRLGFAGADAGVDFAHVVGGRRVGTARVGVSYTRD